MTEPMLTENPDRFCIFPIKDTVSWTFYKKAQASFWTAEEITLSDDRLHWATLTSEEQHFIKHVLAFFASADGIVNENLAQNFFREVQSPEIRCFYGFQIAMENIHGEVYSLLIDTLIEDSQEKEHLFRAIETFPSISRLSQWALRWLDDSLPFNQRLIAFACVEGILFSGPFCAIFWLKKRGLMPGLTFSNELISRDENLHMEFACHLNSLLENPASPETALQIVREAVEFEQEFINESLPCNLIGMKADDMNQYIHYVADRLLIMLGYDRYWKEANPFPWMDLISTQNKTNFFEKRVGEYSRAQFTQSKIKGETATEGIQILEDF